MWSSLRRSALRSSSYRAVPMRTSLMSRYSMPQGQFRLLSTNEYHNIADDTLESITMSYENLINEKPEIDVDLSQGVLTLTMPVGTYVINKQPPNHQIWLSSPISGPKRFEWDDDKRKWVSPREFVTLGELLRQETRDSISVELDLELD